MTPTTPELSVVIPTVDRASLLGGAIESALGQTVEDIEVVVVDNGSRDDTAMVARASGDDRVRYVRRAERHPMHESWRYAVAQARGAYVTVLCDDDALHPRALEVALEAATHHDAEVVGWRACTHYSGDGLGDADGLGRDRVFFGPPYADRPFLLDGKRLLDLAFELRVAFTDLVPKLLNSIVARSLLDRITQMRGQLFPPTACPDYALMLGFAARARGIVLLDAPLTVSGASPVSIGASSLRRGEAARVFLEELRAGASDLILPVAVGPRITWMAQTLMQCAAADYVHEGRVVDTVNLYGLAGIEIAEAEKVGLDVGVERADYETALAGPLAPEAEAIRAFVAERRAIACESYIAPLHGAEAILGLGAFDAPEVPAGEITGEAGGARTADVARGLDAWLSREAARLAPSLEAHNAQAGDRTIVLFGMGQNGRALRRAWPDGRKAAVVDDHADRTPPGVDRLTMDELDPRRHFVVVTPAEATSIMTRLQNAGFVPNADVVTLVSRTKSTGSSSIRSIDRSAVGK